MKLLSHILGISLVIFSEYVFLNEAEPAASVPETSSKALSYIILKEGGVSKVKITLSGSEYSSTKCYIKKSDENAENYADINECPDNENTNDNNKCVITCSKENNKMTFAQFSPRAKYVAVFTDNDITTVAGKTTGGTVFGLELRLLVNPQVTISTTSNKKLKLSTMTCKNVACPIYYKGVQYAAGTMGSSCTNPIGDNEVEFNLMIPHYEMRCEHYPSFFYKLQNKYTLKEMDVYQPQYYVKFKDTDKKKYQIKFTNKFPFEICRFSIREMSTTEDNGTTPKEYVSKCGGTEKDCYAPCNDVELTFVESKVLVEVMIQTRHFPLGRVSNQYLGYIQEKFVTETSTTGGQLLSTITKNGVTLNVPLFNPSAVPKFTSCTVTHYAADKPAPTSGTTTNCGSSNTSNCPNTCEPALTITGLSAGKPYILLIAADTSNGIKADFKEKIFFRTQNGDQTTFPSVIPSVSETAASIQAISGDDTLTKEDVTCAYYISPRGKDVYVCAMCIDSYPCRGLCRETQNIVGLKPGSEYDLKVVAHKDYGFKVHPITTAKSTFTLTKEFVDKGFKIVGTLSTPDSEAKCHYNVEVKKGNKYTLIHQCPQVPISPKPAETPSNKSKLSKIMIARSTADSTSPQPSKTTSNMPTYCIEPPSCSEILFTTNYDRSKKYRVVVTRAGAEDANIEIPENPIVKNQDITKQIIISIERDGNKLKVTSALPQEFAENTCGWELRDSTNPENILVKSCNGENDGGCETLPKCKEFEITGVEDTNDYQLTVYVSSDKTINGNSQLKKGESHDTMKSTIIIVAAVVGVVVLAAVALVFIKKRN